MGVEVGGVGFVLLHFCHFPSAGLPALHPVALLDFVLVTHNSMRYMESSYFSSGRKVDLRAYEVRTGAEFGAMPRRLSNRPLLFPSLLQPLTLLSLEYPDEDFQHAPRLSLVHPRSLQARDRSRGRLLPTPDLVGQREPQRVRPSLSLPSPLRFSFWFHLDSLCTAPALGGSGVLVRETISIIPLENVKTVSYARIDPIVSPGEPHRHGGWTSSPSHRLTVLGSLLNGALGFWVRRQFTTLWEGRQSTRTSPTLKQEKAAARPFRSSLSHPSLLPFPFPSRFSILWVTD